MVLSQSVRCPWSWEVGCGMQMSISIWPHSIPWCVWPLVDDGSTCPWWVFGGLLSQVSSSLFKSLQVSSSLFKSLQVSSVAFWVNLWQLNVPCVGTWYNGKSENSVEPVHSSIPLMKGWSRTLEIPSHETWRAGSFHENPGTVSVYRWCSPRTHDPPWSSICCGFCRSSLTLEGIHPASRGGAAHTAGFFGQLKHIYKKSGKNIVFISVFTMCSVENTVIYAVFGIKSVQNSGFCSVFKALASKKVQCRDLPKPLKTQLFKLFSSIFPCANAAGQLKHIYKKSFKSIVFLQCVYIFSVKNAVIYTFFGLKSVQNTVFCSVFNALASKNHSKYRYLQCFFISVRFSRAGSRPKWPKIPFQYHLKLRHPKIVEKTRKHHQYEVSVRNPVWAPPPS